LAALLALALTAGTAGAAGETVSLVLPLKVDQAGMQRFALAVSNPRSPQFGQYETVAELAQRFGASQGERNRVLGYFRSLGVRSVRIDTTGSLAQVSMSLSLAQRVFAAPVRVLRARDGTRYITPVVQPAVPQALSGAVTGVLGLDTRPFFTGTLAQRSAGSSASSARPNTGKSNPTYCAGGRSAGEVAGDPTTRAYTPDEYLSAYDFGPLRRGGANGSGQRAALIEVDSVKHSDLATFASCFHLRLPTIRQFKVAISKLPPPGEETTLDAEILDSAAPGLKSIDIYETRDDAASVLNGIGAPLQSARNVPSVISISGGACDPNVRAALGRSGLEESQFLLEGETATGTSVIASSGDSGSAGCQRPSGFPQPRLAVQYPASSWWVTAVGGTNFELTPQNQIVPGSEVVWNDQSSPPRAGGGGESAIWTEPPYQTGVISTSATNNSRAVPDVALLADPTPGYAIYCSAPGCGPVHWQAVAGTSASAPLFAGGIALIDQIARGWHPRKEYVGLPQAYFYLFPPQWRYGTTKYPAAFHDITQGSNAVAGLSRYSAGPGFDMASGIGSVDMYNFASYTLSLLPSYLGEVRARVPAGQHPVKAGKLVVYASCSQACYQSAEAVIQIGKSQPFEVFDGIPPKIVHHTHGGSSKFPLDLSGEESQLRAALKHHQKIFAIVYGVITDRKGNFLKYSPAVTLYLTS